MSTLMQKTDRISFLKNLGIAPCSAQSFNLGMTETCCAGNDTILCRIDAEAMHAFLNRTSTKLMCTRLLLAQQARRFFFLGLLAPVLAANSPSSDNFFCFHLFVSTGVLLFFSCCLSFLRTLPMSEIAIAVPGQALQVLEPTSVNRSIDDEEDSLIACLAEVTGLSVDKIRHTVDESSLLENLGVDSLSSIRLWNMLHDLGFNLHKDSISSIGDVLKQMRNSLSVLTVKSSCGSAVALAGRAAPTAAAEVTTGNLEAMLEEVKSERMKIDNMLTRKETGLQGNCMIPVTKYAIIGCGGHAREVISFMKQEGRVEICGIYDDNEAMHGTIIDDVRVEGSTSEMPLGVNWVICIGQNEVRKQINDRLDPEDLGSAGIPYYSANEVFVAASTKIGVGSFIGRGAFFGPGVTIGKHCIIQPGVHIGHDATVGGYVFIGGRVMMGGFAEVQTGTVVGMGTIIAPKVKVGAWSNVMINSVVVTDIPAGMICGGVPALLFGKCSKATVGQFCKLDRLTDVVAFVCRTRTLRIKKVLNE